MSNVLSFQLERTADWRRRKAERHPEDVRNSAAVTLLSALATDRCHNTKLSDLYNDIESDVDDKDHLNLDEARDEVLRVIGFHFFPKSVDEVIKEILSQLDRKPLPGIENLFEHGQRVAKEAAAATAAGKTVN